MICHGPAAERGAVTAELAVALTAVLLVALLGVAALGAGAHHVRLQDAAADAARLLARDEDEGRAAGIAAGVGARLGVTSRGDLVCATVSADARVGHLSLPLQATSCALDGGL